MYININIVKICIYVYMDGELFWSVYQMTLFYLFIYLFHLFTQGVPKQLTKTGFHWGPANTHE